MNDVLAWDGDRWTLRCVAEGGHPSPEVRTVELHGATRVQRASADGRALPAERIDGDVRWFTVGRFEEFTLEWAPSTPPREAR